MLVLVGVVENRAQHGGRHAGEGDAVTLDEVVDGPHVFGFAYDVGEAVALRDFRAQARDLARKGLRERDDAAAGRHVADAEVPELGDLLGGLLRSRRVAQSKLRLVGDLGVEIRVSAEPVTIRGVRCAKRMSETGVQRPVVAEVDRVLGIPGRVAAESLVIRESERNEGINISGETNISIIDDKITSEIRLPSIRRGLF